MKIVIGYLNEFGLALQMLGLILMFSFESVVLTQVQGGLWQAKFVDSFKKAWFKVKIGLWFIVIGLSLQLTQSLFLKLGCFYL